MRVEPAGAKRDARERREAMAEAQRDALLAERGGTDEARRQNVAAGRDRLILLPEKRQFDGVSSSQQGDRAGHTARPGKSDWCRKYTAE